MFRTLHRVVIVQRRLTHYRVPFFNRLRALLCQEGIELQLLIGEGTLAEKQKKDEGFLDWAITIPTRYLLDGNLCWQPFGSYLSGANLIIVAHENKLLYNHWLLSFGRPQRIAFWGHGRNMQSHQPDNLKEIFKRWTIRKVDWWFAYTDITAALVAETGFSRQKITVVDNTIDTDELAQYCELVSAADCHFMRKQLGLGDGPVGLFLGSLYKDKRLDFLVEAAQQVRSLIPGFQLVVVGAGPNQVQIKAAAHQHSWLHYLEALHGRDKATALVLADVMLNPGLVGLGILDSFVSGTPMFTTNCGIHSPEISYLESGKNGVMTANDVNSYSAAVASVLLQPKTLVELRVGALASAPRYSIDGMADRFCAGILACLSFS